MADRVDKFDDWWREVGYAQIPRADELPAYASIARLAWTAALALPAEPPKCKTCGRLMEGKVVGGEYACPECGRPRLHDPAEPPLNARISDSIVYLPCGHGKWDCRWDCLTCCQFTIEQLNQRLSNEAVERTLAGASATPEPSEARISGEDAWLDEFALCGSNKDKLRSVLRAYHANLAAQP